MRAPEHRGRRAKQLRRALTPPEARLWVALKGRQLCGLHFRKQHSVGPYVLDFYCSEVALAVEVDGQQHWADTQAVHDQHRDWWLGERGVRTLRVSAEAVRIDLDTVLLAIAEAAGRAASHPALEPLEGPLSHPADAG
jgi:very-short-patch-repair endonuclease